MTHQRIVRFGLGYSLLEMASRTGLSLATCARIDRGCTRYTIKRSTADRYFEALIRGAAPARKEPPR